MMELAPVLAVTPVDSPDIAHGPLVQEAMVTPQAVREKAQEVAKDLPLLEPSPVPEPEVALPTPRPEAKEEPKQEEAKEPVREKQDAEQASAAPLTHGTAARRGAAGTQLSRTVAGPGAQHRARAGELAEKADRPSEPPQAISRCCAQPACARHRRGGVPAR